MFKKIDDLLEVAGSIFYENVFNGMGLKQIIKEVNVATMTLYNHFDSKEQLIEVEEATKHALYLANSLIGEDR